MIVDLSFQDKFDCSLCSARCDGKSKEAYIFTDDVARSETAEDWILKFLIKTLGLSARKTTAERHGLPDIEIFKDNSVKGYVEVKDQSRTFMSVKRLLPNSNLLPYETIALNLSDLERYISIFDSQKKAIYIIWRVQRPCLGLGFWGQHISVLKTILEEYGRKRRYRRRSTRSDYVNGVHKGVTVNYHFSLRELRYIDELKESLRGI